MKNEIKIDCRYLVSSPLSKKIKFLNYDQSLLS